MTARTRRSRGMSSSSSSTRASRTVRCGAVKEPGREAAEAADERARGTLRWKVDDAADLKAHNEKTISRYANFPEPDRADAHVERDADGYYVVKEEWRKPTNPFEKFKLAKDPMKTLIGLNEIEAMAEASAKDFKAWDESLNDPDETDQRPKWAGLFHRRKGHYGRYMMRLKLPNGLLNSTQARYLASVIEKYGDDGCCDITTRQNIQLRGVELKDAPEILRRLEELNLCSLQSGLDNVRNATGNPLAGFDPREIVDTRPYTLAIQDYVTGGGRGNPAIANLGRKWNVCVVGSSDFFEHPDINDLAFIPAEKDGKLGFNLIVGGFISSQRAAESVSLDAWVPENEVVAATHAVLTTFRDYGHRGNRQKCRMMWLIDEMGLENFRAEVQSRMPSGEMRRAATEDLIDRDAPRRSYVGVHAQKQDGLSWIAAAVPGGRMQPEDLKELADLADEYGTGEIRLTVEQNFIVPNVPNDRVDAILNERLFREYTPFPGKLVSNMVACTGNQFCGFAQIETKRQALEMAEHLESVLELSKDVRMIWTGCPNSCAPVQVADIGLMGAQVKNPTGEKGMVPGVNIFIGGTVGPNGHLKENPEIEKVPCSELKPVLEEIMIERFGATRKATPTTNPGRASRWKINKSAQYTKGVPKAMGKATHICTGCGYIYQETKPFGELPDDYVCPSCSAPKSKFEAMKTEETPTSARPVVEYPEGTLVALKPGETIKLKLIEKEQVTANSVRVRFELPSPEHVLGLPVGQHVVMTIDGVSRPYTPISRDADKGFMDLLVKIYDQGALTQKLNAVEIGSTVDFEGPKGLVTYTARGEFSTRNPATGEIAKKSCKSIAMIAGGTGITPMLQVIRQIFNDVGDTTRVNVLFANVSSADILMKKELDALASAHKNLTVHYAIDADEPGWTGEVGYVSADMIKKCELLKPSGLLNKLFGSADGVDEETAVLVCGPPAMVEKAVVPALDAMNVPIGSRIFF
jgi:ferredoxin-nitrite reductase